MRSCSLDDSVLDYCCSESQIYENLEIASLTVRSESCGEMDSQPACSSYNNFPKHFQSCLPKPQSQHRAVMPHLDPSYSLSEHDRYVSLNEYGSSVWVVFAEVVLGIPMIQDQRIISNIACEECRGLKVVTVIRFVASATVVFSRITLVRKCLKQSARRVNSIPSPRRCPANTYGCLWSFSPE